MRKIAIVLALLMLMPASAFGMQMLTDSGMDQITGQSGVTIAMDDVQLFINIDRMAYIDNDGLSTSATMNIENALGAPGALYIQDFQIDVLNINAIVGTDADAHPETLNLKSTSAGSIPLFYDYGDTTPISGGHLTSSPGGLKGLENYTPVCQHPVLAILGSFTANAIQIEVTDRLPALTEGLNYNTGGEWFSNNPVFPLIEPGAGLFGIEGTTDYPHVGGVFITMPTAEIYIQSLGFTVAYTGNVYAQSLENVPFGPQYVGPMVGMSGHAINDAQGMFHDDNPTPYYPRQGDFGSIDMQGITFTQLSGWMEIAPH